MSTNDSNKNSENIESRGDSITDTISSAGIEYVSRIFGPVKILFKMHIRMAKKELKSDIRRVINGIVSLAIGFFLMSFFYILLNIVGIFLLKTYVFKDSFIFPVLIDAGVNLILAIFFIVSAKGSFSRPFLKETKENIQETLKELK